MDGAIIFKLTLGVLLGKKMPLYETVEQEVMILGERVREAERLARIEQNEMNEKGSKRKKGSDDDDDDDDDNEDKQDGRTVRKFKKKFKKNNRGAGGKVKKFHKKPSGFKKRG